MAQIILDSNNNLIQGDFDNATINNRTKFKTTTTNATTNVYAVPNGSATSAGFTVTNAADPTNASKLTIATNGSTDTQIISGVNGSGTYLPMSFYTNNAQSMIIDTSQNVGIGTTSPSSKFHVNTSSTSDGISIGQGGTVYTLINSAGVDTNIIATNSLTLKATGANIQTFYTNGSERMRIDSSGNVLVAKTSTSSATVGINLEAAGAVGATRSGDLCFFANRLSSDGTLFSFRQDSTEEGTISVSGTTVSYNGGHLSRWSQWQNETGKPSVYRGTILESTNDMCEWEKDGKPLPNEQATKTIVSTTVASKAVAGVFDRYDEDDETNPYDFYVAQSGDFVIRIAQGVTVQNGDLLESAGDGTAKPQTDDICRSSTIAKVTSNYVSATYEDGSYCVPCILMIG